MKKRRLVVSSGNINKIREIKHILEGLPIEVLSKKDMGLEDIHVIEDGNSLEENCIKKVRALANKTDYMVLADDSGLFVDFLDNEPGVHSSRYAGEESNDDKNNEKLLRELKDVVWEERKASFKTVIALMTEGGQLYVVEGQCKGRIGLERQGDDGFGYDPLFIPEGYQESFAQLGEEIKDQISHRARALEKLKEELIRILEAE